MARPIPARFYVNSGIVSSRTDIHNLLRPLVKQTVAYRYFRGRDLVASGTGWVERVVIDEPETSSYFTPISICLNVDLFEQLDFETRPDQLIVYTLVEGDERVVLEYAPAGEREFERAGAGPACVRHERLRPDGAAGLAGRRRALIPDPSGTGRRSWPGPETPATRPRDETPLRLLAHVRDPERGRRADAPLGQGRRRGCKHHDRHDVGQRREELGRELDARSPGG